MMKPYLAGLAALLASASLVVAQEIEVPVPLPVPEVPSDAPMVRSTRDPDMEQEAARGGVQVVPAPGPVVNNVPVMPTVQSQHPGATYQPMLATPPAQGMPIIHEMGDSHDVTHCESVTPDDISNTRKASIWGGIDYLLWWVKDGPASAPLITTNPNSGTIGAIGEPGTVVLAGGSANTFDYGSFSGVRATVGGWIDYQKTCGAEFSYMELGTNTTNFSASSAGGSAPLVSIPFFATVPFNLNPAGETSLNAGRVPNTVSLTSSSRLWGAEANDVFRLRDCENGCMVLLVGVRYMQLNEGLGLNDTFNDATTGGIVSVTDSFATSNEFWGGELGWRCEYSVQHISFETTLKCAVGVNYATVDINGDSVVTKNAFGFASGTYPAGVFAEPSNIGRHATTMFCVVPEAQFQLGYEFNKHLRAVVGYSFLDITDVARPGQQIDRNINPTQNPLFGGTGGVLQGAPSPLGAITSSNFWAQGVNFGVHFRF
jgi:hypothetical protein